MEDFTVDIEPRTEGGSAVCRRYRKAGKIPAIVYHRGEESVQGVVSESAFVQKATRAARTQIFRLRSEDSKLNDKSVLVREVQKDYSTGKELLLHIDFMALKEDEEISLRIPIKFIGEAPGVKTEGGVLSIVSHDIGISCLPRHIPHRIEVDISNLHLGKSIHASDVKLSSDLTLTDEEEETLVTVVLAKTTEVAAPVEGAASDGAAAPAAATPKAGGKEK